MLGISIIKDIADSVVIRSVFALCGLIFLHLISLYDKMIVVVRVNKESRRIFQGSATYKAIFK